MAPNCSINLACANRIEADIDDLKHSTEHLDFAANSAILAHQGTGAMIVLCLGGLWMARSHLRSVGRGAFGPRGQVNDDDEIMSYRAAVFSTLGGSLFMILVLMPPVYPFGPV